MPQEMIVGKIKFSPSPLDTYSAGRQIEFNDMRAEILALRELVGSIKAWDVSQYMTIPHELRARIESALTHNRSYIP